TIRREADYSGAEMQEQLTESEPVVVEATDQNFLETVIEESKKRPVVVDLWASWCGPCRTLGPILERVAGERGGAFLLAKLDVDANPYTAGQFGVQSIPTVVAFRDGQPIDGFVGAIPAPMVNGVVDKLMPTEAELEAEEALEEELEGHLDDAEQKYREALEVDPNNRDARVGLARIYAETGREDQARETLAPALPDPEAERILAMLEVRDWAKLTEPGTLASAKRLAAQGTWREALDAMLGALPGDPDARQAMLEVFTVLGEDDELGAEYRRKPAGALFCGGDHRRRPRPDPRLLGPGLRHLRRDALALDLGSARGGGVASGPRRGASPARLRGGGPGGAGALSRLAAELGYEVTALALSPGMLGRAEFKAKERGLDERMRFVVGSGTEPPDGPFDAVMEPHVLWTLPDPVGALARWREVSKRLVLFEGVWGEDDLRRKAKDLSAEWLRRLMGVGGDHHAPYPAGGLADLPLARLPSPVPLIDAVHEAGWSAVRIKRLRDVEWAGKLHEPWPLGWLEQRPRYTLVAGVWRGGPAAAPG